MVWLITCYASHISLSFFLFYDLVDHLVSEFDPEAAANLYLHLREISEQVEQDFLHLKDKTNQAPTLENESLLWNWPSELT